MNSLVTAGIIPSTTGESHLTDCGDPATAFEIDPDTESCSVNNFDNAAFVEYFNLNCAGRKTCNINLSSYVEDDPTNICNINPSRVYFQMECTLSDRELSANKEADYISIYMSIFGSLLFVGSYFTHLKL